MARRRQEASTGTRRNASPRGRQRAAAASTNWYAAVDDRVRAHFKDWAWAAIDDRIREHFKSFTNMYNGVVGEVIGKIGARARKECKAAIEELVDEVGVRLVALEKRLVSNEAIGGAQVRAQRDEFKCALEEAQRSLEMKLAAVEERLLAVPGKLPVSKIWRPESVTYQAEVVSCDGALWQARRDTAQAPGGSDWICVARAGRDGLTLNVCGMFDAYKTYARLDVVEFDGSSFIAVRDLDLGTIPGDDGWQCAVCSSSSSWKQATWRKLTRAS